MYCTPTKHEFPLRQRYQPIHKHATCIRYSSFMLLCVQFVWPLDVSARDFNLRYKLAIYSPQIVSNVHNNFLNQQRATRVISIATLLPPYERALSIHFRSKHVCHPWRTTNDVLGTGRRINLLILHGIIWFHYLIIVHDSSSVNVKCLKSK